MDDASLQTGAGVGLQLKALIGHTTRLPASNNENEYEAILAGVNLIKSVSSEKLVIRNDSQLIVELASWAGRSGWAGPTLGQGNNRA